MSYLAGGVMVAVALTMLNLLLTFGVIRRLREHTELLSERSMGPPELMLGVGQSPDSFSATATDGEQVSPPMLVGEQLVGFFSPNCQPCKEKAPLFAQRAAAVGRVRALAVVVGGPDEVGELVTLFEPVARVVVQSSLDSGSIANAFKVKGFPAICTLDSRGVVVASGFDVIDTPTASLVS